MRFVACLAACKFTLLPASGTTRGTADSERLLGFWCYSRQEEMLRQGQGGMMVKIEQVLTLSAKAHKISKTWWDF